MTPTTDVPREMRAPHRSRAVAASRSMRGRLAGARAVAAVLTAAAVAALLAPPASARATAASARATGCSQARGQARSGLVPVWAYVNGRTPVAGAPVVLMRKAGNRWRTLSGPRRRTNSFGVALLCVRQVPRSFTVQVRGGRAGGRKLAGSLRLEVSGYRRDDSVLEVNPLTTLVAYMTRIHPRMRHARARALIKHYYRIPAWADLGADMRDSRWFDAGAYLRAVRHYGSVSALNRAVAIRIFRGGRAPRPATLSYAARASVPGRPDARIGSFFDKPLPQRIKEIFSSLRATTKETLKGAVVESALGWVLDMGRLVTGTGPDPGSPEHIAEQFKLVREQLSALGEQVTQLHGKVDELSQAIAGSDASRLLHQSDTLLASIDHASGEIEYLARLSPTDAGYNDFADKLSFYIETKLTDGPRLFKHMLNPTIALADNAIKATSRALGQKRFFDARDSKLVDSVYNYYAVYQTQLATLLTNYWNTQPKPFPPAYQQPRLTEIEDNVTQQRESLKPAVPGNAFIDTRHPDLLYYTDDQVVSAYDLLLGHSGWLTHLHWRAGGYMRPATAEQLRLLFQDAGEKPGDWLRSQLSAAPQQTYWWTRDESIRFYSKPGPFGLEPQWSYNNTGSVGIKYFFVNAAQMREYTTPDAPGQHFHWEWPYYGERTWVAKKSRVPPDCGFQDPATQAWLKSKPAALIFTRNITPGEYWWTSASGATASGAAISSMHARAARIPAAPRPPAAHAAAPTNEAARAKCETEANDTRGVSKVFIRY